MIGVLRNFYKNTRLIYREEKREGKGEGKEEEKGVEMEKGEGERSKSRRRRLGVRSSHITPPKKGLFRQAHIINNNKSEQ